MARSPWPIVLLAIVGVGSPSDAGEPRAAFTLKRGWVEIQLQQDGKPVGGAIIQILDERGARFADGESGPGGETAFPMPNGSCCVVEIKIGSRSADPIRLFKTDGGVEPARVLLSYGLRPCCRSMVARPESIVVGYPTEAPSGISTSSLPWLAGAIALSAIAILAAHIVWLRCHPKEKS